ncbi:hypothetical protein KSZ_07340 [Dictyobacter formicarum]|uniref:Uncharacterized protein n=1 Tax=Dictyobacter formicarum TaxID=2778368 RepID=A0ABQ3VBE6_9CHLR|nr:hypothetical protein KSZ_07340 [Dictyobacter formicarum]
MLLVDWARRGSSKAKANVKAHGSITEKEGHDGEDIRMGATALAGGLGTGGAPGHDRARG